MGQKVHPIGFRLGFTKSWGSRWYADHQYAAFLREDMSIRAYIQKKFAAAGLARVDIERAAKNLKVTIHSSRPGVIIGKKGAGAESLKEELVRRCKLPAGELSLNVYEVRKPDTDAQIVADSIRTQLERRISFRRAMKKAIQSAMKAGAKGIKVQCSGRLGGADMSRVERYHEGRVPLHTLRANIDYGTAEALTTYGLTGIKVWVFHGSLLDGTTPEQPGRTS